MHGIAAAVLSIILSFAAVVMAAAPLQAQSSPTVVGVTICTTGSSITLSAPQNDSVVTAPQVSVAGTATQASQVVVYVDDQIDHVVPLAIGQTAFTTNVQLATGTHTIKAVAIDVCGGINGEASRVITYTLSPAEPSDGGKTATEIPAQTPQPPEEGFDASSEDTPTELESVPLPEIGIIQFRAFLEWLNINVADSSEEKKLSVWSAVMMSTGVYLLMIGMAASVIKLIASIPLLVAVAPAAATPARMRQWVSWGFRILGLLLILAALCW